MESFLSQINFFDIVVFFIITVSTIVAFFRGLIKAFFSTVTWLGSFLTTIALKPYVKSFFVNYIENETVAGLLSVVLTFLVIFIILATISYKLIQKLANYRKGAIDRSLGVLMGFVRGVLSVSVIFYVINSVYAMSEQEQPKFVTQAKSYNALKVVSGTIFSFVPEKALNTFNDKMKNTYDSVSKSVQDSVYDNINKSQSFKELSEEENRALKKLMKALPKKDAQQLNSKYGDGDNLKNNNQRLNVISSMLELYKNSASQGKIQQSKLLNTNEIKTLEKVVKYRSFNIQDLIDSSQEDGTGYKKNNRIQFDRLINNLL